MDALAPKAESGSWPPARPVSTTDLWKAAALVLMFVDHYGFYFEPDENWWRAFGRVTAPVFFFLIGFARTRSVPWTWLAFGALLTTIDAATAASPFDAMANILLNFALIRAALPGFEAQVLPFPGRLAAFVLLCVALAAPLNPILEYSSQGWLWALFGLLHRRTLADGGAALALERVVVGLIAAATYIVVQTLHFAFDPSQAAVVAVLIAGLTVLLLGFRRADSTWQPPRPISDALAFLGRYTLEIYALHLIALKAVHVLT